jgi:DNA polymerase (family 10)
MDNITIAGILDEIADMLSVDERPNSRFEVRAYRKAAQILTTLQEPAEDIYKKGGTKALMELPGIGKSIASHIEELVSTGKLQKYEQLKEKYPINMAELTTIQGLGAKRAVILYKELGVKNIADVKKAIKQHKIRGLDGFGEKSEEMIQKGIEMAESSQGRMLLGDALPIGESIVKKLLGSGLVEKATIAGSARRMRETVGDLDILAISSNGEKVMDFFVGMDNVERAIVKGPTKTTALLKIGITCDLRVLKPKSFGAAVQYFTGSRDHNIQTRQIAMDMGYKLNEYGLFDKRGRNIGGAEEPGIYEKIGLQWMPPEMREARGEVELAKQHKIPKLVELNDIRGDMHTHTKETDGMNTIEELTAAQMKAGREYFATTNHTKSLYIANGLNENGFTKYFKKVDALNEELGGKIRILKGAEVDILKDGKLDLSSESLKKMDCVIAAVHTSFQLDQETMTQRIIRAIDTGLVHVLAHPTGRIINGRPPYKVDLEKVAEAAERNGVALEINAHPSRLDLNDTNIMLVSKYKILFSIDTDAHSTDHISIMRYGVGTARRGWLTKERVLNTLPLKKLEQKLDRQLT